MKHMQEKRRKFLKTFFMVDHDGMSAQQFAATAVKRQINLFPLTDYLLSLNF